MGALDFQARPIDYVARDESAALDQLMAVAELVESGAAIPADLTAAAGHGTSIGGARPKALLRDGRRQLIAKFSSTTDTRPVVQAEGAAMLLAARVGLDVAPVETRLAFNVCVGDNDDHLRNHAAFWDGTALQLTPAYDLSPQPRSTDVSTQAIGLTHDGRRHSQLWLCRQAAADFTISPAEAADIIGHVRTTIEQSWHHVCDEVLLTRTERRSLMGREFLNPYIAYDEP